MRYRLNYPENFSEKNPESRQVGMRSSNNDNFFFATVYYYYYFYYYHFFTNFLKKWEFRNTRFYSFFFNLFSFNIRDGQFFFVMT